MNRASGDDRSAKLIEAGLALSSELSLSAVLQRIVDLAAELCDARYGALGVIGPTGAIDEFVTTGISPEDRRAIGDPPVGKGVLGLLIEEAKPIRIEDLTRDPRSVGVPPSHPQMHSFLGAPVEARGRVFGNIYLSEKRDLGGFTDEDERALVVLATQAGVAIENARLYEEGRRRERWLDAVREIATATLAGAGSDVALELVARRARELVRADLATITTPVAEGEGLQLQVADGAHADRLRGMRFQPEDSISGEVMRTGRAEVIEDTSVDHRALQPAVALGELGPAMLVPLQARGEAIGTLAVFNQLGGRLFSSEDLRLLETFADQAAVALEYAQAQKEIQRLAVLEDRERIAKELHDGVIQSLFAVGMGLEATGAIAEDEAMSDRIESAVAELDRVIRDLRNYIFGLRPGILADRQLDQALRHLIQDFQEKTGVVGVVELDGEIASELASRAADVIQMTRECLSNVGRHAGAATCRVSLRRDGDAAVLEIDDDGRGFDPSTPREGGQGLGNLRTRAASFGGAVAIDSIRGQGTTVRITIPL